MMTDRSGKLIYGVDLFTHGRISKMVNFYLYTNRNCFSGKNVTKTIQLQISRKKFFWRQRNKKKSKAQSFAVCYKTWFRFLTLHLPFISINSIFNRAMQQQQIISLLVIKPELLHNHTGSPVH